MHRAGRTETPFMQYKKTTTTKKHQTDLAVIHDLLHSNEISLLLLL